MKITKYLFLLMLITLNIGCSKYKITPSVEPVTSTQTIKINSYTIHMNEKIKIWTKNSILSATKDILASSTLLDSIPLVTPQENEDYFHIDIDVEYWHGGAGGDAYLSALSLGIIPTSGINKSLFKYKFNLYKNGELYKTNIYSIDEEHNSHILLLPFSLIDNTTSNDVVDLYRKALQANVQVYNKTQEPI